MPVVPLAVPLVDEGGRVSDAWAGFFADLIKRAGRIAPATVGPSPFTYTAPSDGFVSLVGGTVSAVSLVRGSISLTTGITSGMIPVSLGDSLVITYSSAPTINFVPS